MVGPKVSTRRQTQVPVMTASSTGGISIYTFLTGAPILPRPHPAGRSPEWTGLTTGKTYRKAALRRKARVA